MCTMNNSAHTKKVWKHFEQPSYKTHGCIRRTPISAGQIKKKITNIKRDEINIMNFINVNTFNLHNSLLNDNNRFMKVTVKSTAQSAGAVKCSDCRPVRHNPMTVLDMTLISLMVRFQLWGIRSTPSLPSLPGPLRPGVVAPDRVLPMSQIELNCVITLN